MSKYDETRVAEAERAVGGAINDLLRTKPHEAVIGIAPAGAGKSYAVATAVLAVRKEKLRVAVATPTNEQAFALVSSLADRVPRGERVTFVPASSVSLPVPRSKMLSNATVCGSRE